MKKYEDLPRDGDGVIIIEKVEWPVGIDLKRPVEDSHGETITHLELREPTAADIETAWNAGRGEATRMVRLVSVLAMLKPDDVRRLKAIDFMRAAKTVGAFL